MNEQLKKEEIIHTEQVRQTEESVQPSYMPETPAEQLYKPNQKLEDKRSTVIENIQQETATKKLEEKKPVEKQPVEAVKQEQEYAYSPARTKMQEFQRILQTERETRGATKSFSRVVDGMNKYITSDPTKMTQENYEDLFALRDAVNAYLKSHSWHRFTDKGKERVKLMQELLATLDCEQASCVREKPRVYSMEEIQREANSPDMYRQLLLQQDIGRMITRRVDIYLDDKKLNDEFGIDLDDTCNDELQAIDSHMTTPTEEELRKIPGVKNQIERYLDEYDRIKVVSTQEEFDKKLQNPKLSSAEKEELIKNKYTRDDQVEQFYKKTREKYKDNPVIQRTEKYWIYMMNSYEARVNRAFEQWQKYKSEQHEGISPEAYARLMLRHVDPMGIEFFDFYQMIVGPGTSLGNMTMFMQYAGPWSAEHLNDFNTKLGFLVKHMLEADIKGTEENALPPQYRDVIYAAREKRLSEMLPYASDKAKAQGLKEHIQQEREANRAKMNGNPA